ncbi:MAG: VOC family protein [Pseudomonadota bacterium]
MRLLHVSLTARDGDALARFYKDAFGFLDRRPPRRLFGDIEGRGNGLSGADIYSVWLNPPDNDGPFLEIMEYSTLASRARPAVNATGYGHLAFAVKDVRATIAEVMRAGGSMQGEVTDFGTEGDPHLIVYVRDPEGSILELEEGEG